MQQNNHNRYILATSTSKMNKHLKGDEMEKKTEMTIENVQNLYQTIANIFSEKQNLKVQVSVERKIMKGE